MTEDRIFYECVKYFSQKGFKRALELIYQKYRSLGRFSGKIILENPTEEEKEVLSRYLRRVLRGDRLVIDVKEFAVTKFQDTKFSGVDFKSVLSAVLKKEVITKKEEKYLESERVLKFFESLSEYFEADENAAEVLDAFRENFKWFESYYKKYSQKEFLEMMKKIIEAILKRPQSPETLAIFATRTTGNPHFFDHDKDAGKIFLKLLSILSKREYPQNAEEKSELLFDNNILIDELSNWCLLYNIGGYVEDGKEDEGLRCFGSQKKPLILPLYTIKDYKGFFAYSKNLVIVENPAVFSAIVQKVPEVSAVCTNGHLRLSCRIVIESIAKTNIELLYSGDFDPEGLLIADRVIQNFGAKPLCMDESHYLLALSQNKIDERRLEMLKNVKSAQLQSVCRKMKELQLAGYQERIVDRIIEELQS
ncbi:TIGR02679 domain-containing protein [Anaerocellum danielii]|uniref:TIGR02679 domain-containing protein n=1 Tax=Anaerocellum danielii TaxID=1387557 RepID=A0ABZ0U091_9FIRM|nr:TIGR02679 domain-containing protein [Caldicellulosiruptor danielii]WPX09085.1 TIGR02679 domain-containing protein [Caldicellulosiruptor danielii]